MIFINFPPALTRIFEGEKSYEASCLSDLIIVDEEEESNEKENAIPIIQHHLFNILKERKYSSICSCMLREIDEFDSLVELYFQVPRYSIAPDGMELDERLVTYCGVIRYKVINDLNLEDLFNLN